MPIRISKKGIAACLIVSAIGIAGAGSAFAADAGTAASTKTVQSYCSQKVDIQSVYQTALSNLVSNGTITQSQADSITNSLPSDKGLGTAPLKKTQKAGGFLSSLVSNGTITQAQAASIEDAMKTARESGKSMSDVLSQLVSSGTITQSQSDSITKNLPDKEGRSCGGFLNSLVTAGTITQDQANAVYSEIKDVISSQTEK